MAEAYEEPLLLLNNNNTDKINYEIVDALNGFEVNSMRKKVNYAVNFFSYLKTSVKFAPMLFFNKNLVSPNLLSFIYDENFF